MGEARTRRRGLWLAVVLVLVAGASACGGAAPMRLAGARSSPELPSCPRSVRHLGLIAFTAQGSLKLVDLARCRVAVLWLAGAGEPSFSADGRWLAFGTGRYPLVVPAHGGVARRLLGSRVTAWAWAPHGDLLYGITQGGSLVSAAPRGPRRVLAQGLDTAYYGRGTQMAISPDGRMVAVDRSRCAPSMVGELDVADVRTGARSVPIRQPGDFFIFAGWSSDGRWLLYWVANQCSGSLDSDGWPLDAVPAAGGSPVRVVPHMLLFDDFLSWCGRRLIAAAGPDRETNSGSELVESTLPGWRRRTLQPAHSLSWVSPACQPGGRRLVAAAGPNHAPVRFGLQHRSIWLLRASGPVVRRLTLPPAALTDEAPRFSRDGRWVLFVRSQVLPVDSSRDTIELVRADGSGAAIPIAAFTSGDFSYYDHFSWPTEIAWSRAGRDLTARSG